jgi:hypothetical protein
MAAMGPGVSHYVQQGPSQSMNIRSPAQMQHQQLVGMGGMQQMRPMGQGPTQQMMNMAMLAGAGGPNVVVGPGGAAMVRDSL